MRDRPREPQLCRGQEVTVGLHGRKLFVVESCRRCVHFLASDLAEVLIPRRPAMDPPCRCQRCRTAEHTKIDLRQVHPGDVGKLLVRRPGKPRVVRDWQDVQL